MGKWTGGLFEWPWWPRKARAPDGRDLGAFAYSMRPSSYSGLLHDRYAVYLKTIEPIVDLKAKLIQACGAADPKRHFLRIRGQQIEFDPAEFGDSYDSYPAEIQEVLQLCDLQVAEIFARFEERERRFSSYQASVRAHAFCDHEALARARERADRFAGVEWAGVAATRAAQLET